MMESWEGQGKSFLMGLGSRSLSSLVEAFIADTEIKKDLDSRIGLRLGFIYPCL